LVSTVEIRLALLAYAILAQRIRKAAGPSNGAPGPTYTVPNHQGKGTVRLKLYGPIVNLALTVIDARIIGLLDAAQPTDARRATWPSHSPAKAWRASSGLKRENTGCSGIVFCLLKTQGLIP
jgi:hypothetical protein